MAIRADRDPRYYTRFLIIGAGMAGFSLWSLYDGLVAYPRQREQALAYEKLVEEERADEWELFALERGWPTEEPEEAMTEVDIQMQFWMAGLTGTIAFLVLLGVWLSRGRWIEASETGITSSWGQSLNFDQIVSVDKRIWRSKGIAKVKYLDGRRKRRFVIDDYKFKREPTDAILRQLEASIDLDKIVNGPPEPLPEEASETDEGPMLGPNGEDATSWAAEPSNDRG